jgi:(R,R)-butanediol dehydrogenase / meso-butanediol dehydrogenase / diacetyl reductase
VRAAVCGVGRDVRVVDIERPAPAIGEVLIDVACCGVCGSDLHMLSAGLVTAGHVLGHEFTGVVAALGPGVSGWTAGDRVAVLPLVACGPAWWQAGTAGSPSSNQGRAAGPPSSGMASPPSRQRTHSPGCRSCSGPGRRR